MGVIQIGLHRVKGIAQPSLLELGYPEVLPNELSVARSQLATSPSASALLPRFKEYEHARGMNIRGISCTGLSVTGLALAGY